MATATSASSPVGASPHNSESHIFEPKYSIQSSKRRKTLCVAVAAIVVIVLGLALGLGLGLGLRNRHDDSQYAPATGAVSSWTNGSRLPFVELEDLVDPSQFILSPSFDVNAAPQTREYWWDITEVIAAPGGISKRMLVVNGKSPGPTIEANLGDRIIVHVNNKLQNITAMHWHGQYQRGSNFMDGTYSVTECGIAPGTTFTYNWTVQNTGSYWWHAHASTQSSDGLFGALILHSPDDPYGFRSSPSDQSRPTEFSYDGDLVLVVNDVYNLFSTDWLSLYLNLQIGSGEGDEPTPDYGVINGIGQANCAGVPDRQSCVRNGNQGIYSNFTVQPNQRYRFRVINAGSLASFDVSVDNHPITIIEADGTPVEPTDAASVNVQVAQRASFIIETNQAAAAYWIRAKISEDMLAYETPTLVKDQRAILRYDGVSEQTMPTEDAAPALPTNLDTSFNTSSLVPLMAMDPPPPTMQSILYVNFGQSSDNAYHAYFNNTAFGVPFAGYSTVNAIQNASTFNQQPNFGGAVVVEVPDKQVLDIIINNQDDGSHPMHLHGFSPFLIASGPGNYIPNKSINLMQRFTNPMRRDVFMIPAYSWTAVRVVADNPGAWVFHCHLSSHMAAGLMMQFVMQPDEIAKFALPDDWKSQCAQIQKNGLINEA